MQTGEMILEHNHSMAVLEEREKTHGNFMSNAMVSQRIKAALYSGAWGVMAPDMREALEMIALKMSRIVTGKADEPDHWHDIAGYAMLIYDRLNNTLRTRK